MLRGLSSFIKLILQKSFENDVSKKLCKNPIVSIYAIRSITTAGYLTVAASLQLFNQRGLKELLNCIIGTIHDYAMDAARQRSLSISSGAWTPITILL